MSTLSEESTFTDQIYEIAIDDMAMGGPGGTVNLQPTQVANRTQLLKGQQDISHDSTGHHDATVLKDQLTETLTNAEISPTADIGEAKQDLDFRGRPRPFDGGVYTSTLEMTQDLSLLGEDNAERDLLQSESVVSIVGATYQRMYGSSGELAIGAGSLSGYDTVGFGGLFCQTVPSILSSNKVRVEGDIRKLVSKFSVQPMSPTDLIFPEAEAGYTLPRTDLAYFRCQIECVSTSGNFFVHGDTANSVIAWWGLTSEQRRLFTLDPANTLFLRADGKVYQIQYVYTVTPDKVSMEDCGYMQDPLDSMLYTSGNYFAIPVCSAARRNQGAYHPEFNPLGTGYFMRDSNPALDDKRFEIGGVGQLLGDNDDFTTWTKASLVVEVEGLVTGVLAQAETLTKDVLNAANSTRYVFFIDIKKNEGDTAERTLDIGMEVENSAHSVLVDVSKTVTLSEDFQTVAISVETPSTDTDHIKLQIGCNTSCDYLFLIQNARYSEDTVPTAPHLDITGTDTAANTITVLGDKRVDFPIGWDVLLQGTPSNDGTYEVESLGYTGTHTVIELSPGIDFNTDTTGQVESVLWHYTNYCFENQSEGEGDNTTGGIASLLSGRFDGKYHDEIDLVSITDLRRVLTETAMIGATLSTPILIGVPSVSNESDVLSTTIGNYSTFYTYNIVVSTGSYEHSEHSLIWTLPEVSVGNVVGTMTVYVTNGDGEFSEAVTYTTIIRHVPIIADEAIDEQSFTDAEFELLEDVAVVDGDIVTVGAVSDGRAVTISYQQEDLEDEWKQAKGTTTLEYTDGTSFIVDSELTTPTTVMVTSGAVITTGDKVGVTAEGIDKIVEATSATFVPALCADDVFSTNLYTTDDTVQAITSGQDLLNAGGLVWSKERDVESNHFLADSETVGWLASNTSEELSTTDRITFNSNGFTIDGSTATSSSERVASWVFRQAPKFFDVQKVTKVAGVDKLLDLSTLETVGMVKVKNLATGSWYTWHRALTAGRLLIGETTAGETTLGHITVSGTTLTLVDGTIADGEYVVYSFAHDTNAETSMIKCGSYTGGNNLVNGTVSSSGSKVIPANVTSVTLTGTGGIGTATSTQVPVYGPAYYTQVGDYTAVSLDPVTINYPLPGYTLYTDTVVAAASISYPNTTCQAVVLVTSTTYAPGDHGNGELITTYYYYHYTVTVVWSAAQQDIIRYDTVWSYTTGGTSTATLGGTQYSYDGGYGGAATPVGPTTYTIPDTGTTLLTYTIASGGSLQYEYEVIGTAVLDIGFEPQFLMVKNYSNDGNWVMVDVSRGIPSGSADQILLANEDIAETPAEYFSVTSTGFIVTGVSADVGALGCEYAYMAIATDPHATPPKGKYSVGIPTQSSAPTEAWKPSPKLVPLLPLNLDLASSIALTHSYTEDILPTWHTLTGAEDEYVAGEDKPLTLVTGLTSTTRVVGASSVANLWSETGLHNKVGLRVAGADVIVDLIDVATVLVGDSTMYTLTIPLQASVPSAAWKPSQVQRSLPIALNVALTTLDTVVGTVEDERSLLGRDQVEITVGGVESIVDIVSHSIVEGPPDTITLTIPTQASVPTAATLVGNEIIPEYLTYDKDCAVVEYKDEDLSPDGDVYQLKLGIGNIEEDMSVNKLHVDLWRTY